MILTPHARYWHKLWSIRFAILTAFFTSASAAYALLPPDWMPAVPHWVKSALALGATFTAGAAGISVVIKQNLGDDK